MSKPNLIVKDPNRYRFNFSRVFHGMLEKMKVLKFDKKSKTVKGHIKGRFSRKVLRSQVRRMMKG